MLKPEISGGVIVYSFEPAVRLKAGNAEQVSKELGIHFENEGTQMLLDMGNVTFVDSTGYGALLSVMRQARGNGGVFRICSIQPQVLKTFMLLHLHKVFDIYETREECLKSFE